MEVLEKQLKSLEAELNKILDKKGMPSATLQVFKTRVDELGYSPSNTFTLGFVVISENPKAEGWLSFAKEKARVKFYRSAYGHYILHI
jgi:hypothetical protein